MYYVYFLKDIIFFNEDKKSLFWSWRDYKSWQEPIIGSDLQPSFNVAGFNHLCDGNHGCQLYRGGCSATNKHRDHTRKNNIFTTTAWYWWIVQACWIWFEQLYERTWKIHGLRRINYRNHQIWTISFDSAWNIFGNSGINTHVDLPLHLILNHSLFAIFL